MSTTSAYNLADAVITRHITDRDPVSTQWPYHGSTENAARANRALGHYWWHADTMRYHGTRVHSLCPEGIMVTSDNDHGPVDAPERRYTVRLVLPWGDVATLGEYGAHRTLPAAKNAAQEARTALVQVDRRVVTQQGHPYEVTAHRLGLPGSTGVVRVHATPLSDYRAPLNTRQALAAARRVTTAGEHVTRQRQPVQAGSGLAGVYRVQPEQ